MIQNMFIFQVQRQINNVQYFQNYRMNPFERLRQTIDKVNITYQYNDEPQSHFETIPSNQPPKNQIVANDPSEIAHIKQLYENNQITQIREITSLSSKMQQLSKSLKRAENTIQTQMNELISLQKENQQLKENLNQQYQNIVLHDERERKFKEEIYRINVTVNELGLQINSERNSKKNLMKELEQAKALLIRRENQYLQSKKIIEASKQQLRSELQERISMFEYNVKKNSEDRQEYKQNLAKNQGNYQKILDNYRQECDKLKRELFQSKKQAEILSLRKVNIEENLEKSNFQLTETNTITKALTEELKQLKSKYEESVKINQSLNQNINMLSNELAEQRKNVKVKVVEVRDQTIILQLEMYRRQCRQLMQEKAIMSSLNRPERILEPGYRIINSQLTQSK